MCSFRCLHCTCLLLIQLFCASIIANEDQETDICKRFILRLNVAVEESYHSPSPSTKKGYRNDQARYFFEMLSEKNNRLQLQQGRFRLNSKENVSQQGWFTTRTEAYRGCGISTNLGVHKKLDWTSEQIFL